MLKLGKQEVQKLKCKTQNCRGRQFKKNFEFAKKPLTISHGSTATGAKQINQF
jgi:hypothetical protein